MKSKKEFVDGAKHLLWGLVLEGYHAGHVTPQERGLVTASMMKRCISVLEAWYEELAESERKEREGTKAEETPIQDAIAGRVGRGTA